MTYPLRDWVPMILKLQNVILEKIARGEALQTTIERLCLEAEA